MSQMRIIFALSGADEKAAIARQAEGWGLGAAYYPRSLPEVESLVSTDSADAIVTDFFFHSGAFAEWLTLWPLPAVLIVDPGDEAGRIEKTLADESSLFLVREPGCQHVGRLPILLHKVLNIRESLSRQNAHLQMTEHQYLNLLQAIPDIVYSLDGQGCFIYLNDAVRSLGFEPAKLIGKHFSEIIHPSDVPKVSRSLVLARLSGTVTGATAAPKLFDERRSGERMTKNLEIRLRFSEESESYRYATVNAYGEVSSVGWLLPEYENKAIGTVGIIRDITMRKSHEQDLEKALAAREVLLRETHHRVKNNLQVVSSLLNLQENVVKSEEARDVFLECQTQIQSMAMVHEVLYRSDRVEGVGMQAYFDRLAEYLSSVFDALSRGVTCSFQAEGVFLDLDDAIPTGLIVNELVSNAFKHAFPGGRRGHILACLTDGLGYRELLVEDDGVGFLATRKPDGSEAGIGTELVNALAAQLRGQIERGPSAGTGARIRIRFPRRDHEE